MRAYRIKTIIETDGELTLRELPLKAGEVVEVIILWPETVKGTQGKDAEGQPLTEEKRRRAEAFARIRSGLFAYKTETGLLPSEEFSLRKAEEKALEERRWK